MKLKRLYLKHFRCYNEVIVVDFDNITTLIGKNDIGKSTIMEALEIFFNNNTVKISQQDLNNKADDKYVCISCEFVDLPTELVIDAEAKTSLKDEYLTTPDNTLIVKKVFDCSKKSPSSEIFIVANHPTAKPFSEILSLKQKELQKIVNDRGLEANRSINSDMRRAIWQSVPETDLQLSISDIDVSKASGGTKELWSNIEKYIPAFALFQSDRQSTDADDEVQNPMKQAVQLAIAEAQAEIDAINAKVQQRAMEIAKDTHKVLKTLDSNMAATIEPKFDAPSSSKWNGLFNISMNTDDGIPLNKRGSGVRRMILVSFFKAEADRKAKESTKRDVIYAIEEPETSMHPNYQELIIQSFYELAQTDNCQVVLTTHSPNLAKELPTDSLRFVTRDESNVPVIRIGEDILPDVVKTLGVLPNISPRVQVVLCVEGPTDVIAMKAFSRCLREKYPEIVDASSDQRIMVIPLGGSSLKHWVENQYLSNLNCREVHIYDNDVNTYQKSVDEVNSRTDGSWATLTNKYEIENYLHPDAILEGYGFTIDTTQKGVPSLFGVEYAKKMGWPKCTDNNAKIKLSSIFEQRMNYDRLHAMDPDGEVKGWFEKISNMLT